MKAFFIKYYILIGAVLAVCAIGGGYVYVRSSAAPTFGVVTVTKGNIISSVNEAGTVLAENSAAVSFQEGGQIAHVYVSEGSTVAAGTVLADLNSSALTATVAQANAALATAQAELTQLQSGTRPEQLQVDESAVASADQALGIATENAYSAADDAVSNQIDAMFTNPQTSNPTFSLQSNNSQAVNDIQNQRLQLGSTLARWYVAMNASSSNFDVSSLSGTAMTNLQKIDAYINTVALVLNNTTPSIAVSSSALAGYKDNVAAARAEVEASISAISGDQSALTAAQNQLTLAQAGATPQAIQTQQAAVAQAQAAVASAQVALDNASLVAPFAGTVQNLTAQVGQVVSAGTPLMSLINSDGLKIQTYVSEADVAKIKMGDTVDVTLDAFGTGTMFPATVTTVDAAQTQVNGSAAYMVTLHFVHTDARIKDGMTGNVQIIEAEHDNVLEVPSSVIVSNGNNNFVLVRNGSATEQQQVQVGLVGDSGMTEITTGLTEGETINNF